MRKFYIILICIIFLAFSYSIYHYISSSDNDASKVSEASSSESVNALKTPMHNADESPTATPTFTPSPTPLAPSYEVLNSKLDAADSAISQDIGNGFPGAVLLVAQNNEIIFLKAYGSLKIYDGLEKLESPVAMRSDTVFDLASLTKVYATTFSIMKLIDSQAISLDSYVYEILPEFNKDDYNKITIRQLLTHTSGFPSDVKFFRPDVEEGEMFYSTDRDKTISLLSEVPLEYSPGSKAQYSDIGYMVLSAVAEKLSGMRIDEFVSYNIYTPLGINDTMSYLPIENNFYIDNIACTERLGNTRDGLVTFPNVREYTLQGEVHDEKAYYSMEGVSGHAGLFSDAESINILNQMLLNGGTYKGVTVFSEDTVNTFTSLYDDSFYQLGFANSAKINSLKDIVPNGTLSHTGWTGTFSLVDKKNNLSMVLLTNKRHTPIAGDEFEGAYYNTGKYYAIVKLIYEALELS